MQILWLRGVKWPPYRSTCKESANKSTADLVTSISNIKLSMNIPSNAALISFSLSGGEMDHVDTDMMEKGKEGAP